MTKKGYTESMEYTDMQALAVIAGETERLFAKIGAQYDDEDAAPDRVAEFIIAVRYAMAEEPEPTLPAVAKLRINPEDRRKLRNKRKAQRRARKANR